ncbi:hypothetical protein AOT82_2629 [Psychrobacter sp. AntiMn-1]|nr:hypothetical protein AOT82_2629 [Psychrobacter sp. AntiMn-1]
MLVLSALIIAEPNQVCFILKSLSKRRCHCKYTYKSAKLNLVKLDSL